MLQSLFGLGFIALGSFYLWKAECSLREHFKRKGWLETSGKVLRSCTVTIKAPEDADMYRGMNIILDIITYIFPRCTEGSYETTSLYSYNVDGRTYYGTEIGKPDSKGSLKVFYDPRNPTDAAAALNRSKIPETIFNSFIGGFLLSVGLVVLRYVYFQNL